MSQSIDLGGNDLVVNSLYVNASGPGQAGTLLESGGTISSGTDTITSTSASSLAVGPNGATTPVLKVDSSTTSAVAGLQIKGAVTGGTVALSAIDSGSNTNLTINAKGTGTIGIGSVSTGAVTITPATTVTGAATLSGGVAVTGTTVGTSASANSLAVGLAGSTNPAFVVDSSTASQAAGLKVTGAATGGTVAVAAIDSGSNTNLTVNAKGTGTIGIGSVSTGAVTITPATTVTGALTLTAGATVGTTLGVTGVTTPTGGVAAAGGYSVSPRLMNTGANPPSVSTDFTDYTVVVTETIRSEVFVPSNTSSTGVAIFNGSANAGNLTAYLIDSTGAQVAVTASTAQSGTDAYQRIAWTGGPIALKGPATYWVAVQGNNTGAKINTHTIGNFGADKQTGTTYGALTVAASPTTFTTALGPVAGLY